MVGNDPQSVNAVVQSEPAREVIVVQQQGVGAGPPPGAPPGGAWIEDKYCGTTTWIVAIFCCFCVCCCPCDKRTVSEHNTINHPYTLLSARICSLICG